MLEVGLVEQLVGYERLEEVECRAGTARVAGLEWQDLDDPLAVDAQSDTTREDERHRWPGGPFDEVSHRVDEVLAGVEHDHGGFPAQSCRECGRPVLGGVDPDAACGSGSQDDLFGVCVRSEGNEHHRAIEAWICERLHRQACLADPWGTDDRDHPLAPEMGPDLAELRAPPDERRRVARQPDGSAGSALRPFHSRLARGRGAG